jgi:hypothetical protein
MLNKIGLMVCAMITVLSLHSCKEDEEGARTADQLFRPAMLQYSVNANEVTFNWIPIKGANYLLEMARDSFQFSNELQRINIEGMAEFTIQDLWSNSRYSARIKSVSTNPDIKDSEFKQVTFVTGTENIFQMIGNEDIGRDHILVHWDPAKTVSHLVVSSGSTGNTTIQLSNEDVLAGQKDITGLSAGTTYTFKIYKGEMLRGTITATTLAIP